MKIAIDCRQIGKSGIGTYIENIANELLENHSENEYLIIKEPIVEIETYHSTASFVNTNICAFSFKEQFCFPVKEINKCDVYYTPYINIPGKISVPIFSTIHDAVFFDLPAFYSYRERTIRKAYIRRTIKRSKAIFTVSQFSQERICHHFNIKKPFAIIGNAIPKKMQNIQTKCVQKDDVIVYVGNIKEHKGLRILLQAYSMAKKDGLTSKLMIIGDGGQFRTNDSEVMKLLSNGRDVIFTGYLSDTDLYNKVRSARILVLPSLYEGFGIPPMEALYLGTNVIISNIPALKEVYQNLPVCFFKSGDSNDLKDKLMNDYPKINVEEVRVEIDTKYNIHNQVNRILEVMEINQKKIESCYHT